MALPIQLLRLKEVEALLGIALREDLGRAGDRTSRALIPAGHRSIGWLRARQAGVAAGLPLLVRIFKRLDQGVKVSLKLRDGQRFKAGQTLAVLRGPTRAILSGERVSLNLLQRLCGVATLTARFVALTRGTRAEILDTRKTTPGLRALEKYAVACGGGHNHRLRLDDAFLIKDNHLASVDDIASALRRANAAAPKGMRVQIEVDTLVQLRQALAAGARWILLDNMTLTQLRRATRLAKGKAVTEASGGVNLRNVRAIAKTGVDRISVGALTHSVNALDLGLDFEASA